jgi:hypothetical protein
VAGCDNPNGFSAMQVWGNCDNDPSNGCETDIASDVDNCGDCGLKCILPHAVNGCHKASPTAQSNCYVVACDPGWSYISTVHGVTAGQRDSTAGNPHSGVGCFYNQRTPSTGCSAAGQCATNNDGHACVGHCGCGSDTDCPGTMTCDSGAANICYCTSSTQCPSGTTCDPTTKACV